MSNRERGQALVLTMAGVALVLFSVLVALTITQFSGRLVNQQLLYQGQALNVAQAGVSEGMSWFNRQTAQPVSTFAPALNLAAVPPVNETEDAATGLVRTFQISSKGNVWGRYELRRTGATSPTTNTVDISSQRGKATNGQIWQLEATGTVFVRNSTGTAYNVSPNIVLARRTIRAEIQRLGFTPPTTAALISWRGDAVNLQNAFVRVIGGTGGGGLAWVTGTGTPPTTTGYPSQVSGSPSTSSGLPSETRFTIPYVFGVTEQELRNMEDYEVSSVSSLPYSSTGNTKVLPDWKLYVLNNPANQSQTYTFDQNNPLTGNGILVVFGNLTIAANSNSTWNGVVYVKGSFSQSAPSTITGTVIVDATTAPSIPTPSVTIGGAGERSEIRYSGPLISYLQRRMGLYTISRPAYIYCTPGPGCD